MKSNEYAVFFCCSAYFKSCLTKATNRNCVSVGKVHIIFFAENTIDKNEACADTDFIDALLNVARTYIYRRRARASLAFWCGGNELYYDDYRPQGLEHPTLRALCDVVKELDGDRLFLPASPSGPVPDNND